MLEFFRKRYLEDKVEYYEEVRITWTKHGFKCLKTIKSVSLLWGILESTENPVVLPWFEVASKPYVSGNLYLNVFTVKLDLFSRQCKRSFSFSHLHLSSCSVCVRKPSPSQAHGACVPCFTSALFSLHLLLKVSDRSAQSSHQCVTELHKPCPPSAGNEASHFVIGAIQNEHFGF